MAHVIAPADAQDGLALALEAAGGTHLPVTIWTPHYPEHDPTEFWPRNDGGHLANLARYHDETWSAELLAGLPRPQRGWGTVGKLPLLWARTESKDQRDRLRRYRPLPNIVLREGDTVRYVAFWLTTRPLNWLQLERANKRLAHYLRAPKKYADPDHFTFPVPGTFLRRGRARPVPVTCERLDLDTMHTVKTLVGRLKDAPDPDAWRK